MRRSMAVLKSFGLLLLLLLLMAHRRTSACGTLYSEVKGLGGSCFPQDSCAEFRPEEDDHLWGNFTCECGVHCIKYGTCCADSPNVGYLSHTQLKGEKCRKLPGTSHPVMLISRCSDRWRHRYDIQNLCENTGPPNNDPVATIPVTQSTTQATYKNYFCALCNYDVADVSFWNAELHFKDRGSAQGMSDVSRESRLEGLVYDHADGSWGVTHDGSFHPVKLKFALPKRLSRFVKKCHPNIVSRCDSSAERRYKCGAYYAPIRVSTKYRNVHCALCNGANVSRRDDDGRCTLDLEVGGKKEKSPFSFALLLDINGGDGERVGRVERCGERETWDPFFKRCRSLVCALPGHVVKDGKCAPKRGC